MDNTPCFGIICWGRIDHTILKTVSIQKHSSIPKPERVTITSASKRDRRRRHHHQKMSKASGGTFCLFFRKLLETVNPKTIRLTAEINRWSVVQSSWDVLFHSFPSCFISSQLSSRRQGSIYCEICFIFYFNQRKSNIRSTTIYANSTTGHIGCTLG